MSVNPTPHTPTRFRRVADRVASVLPFRGRADREEQHIEQADQSDVCSSCGTHLAMADLAPEETITVIRTPKAPKAPKVPKPARSTKVAAAADLSKLRARQERAATRQRLAQAIAKPFVAFGQLFTKRPEQVGVTRPRRFWNATVAAVVGVAQFLVDLAWLSVTLAWNALKVVSFASLAAAILGFAWTTASKEFARTAKNLAI